MKRSIVIIITLLMVAPMLSFAQRKQHKTKQRNDDTLAIARTFISICNTYKSLPLQLQVKFQQQSNIVTDAEDSMVINASFLLDEKNSYISFGSLEQVANDSLIVLVNTDIKKILVYPNTVNTASQLSNYIGIQEKDSTLEAITKKYDCKQSLTPGGEGLIELSSKANISFTNVAKESLTIRYNPQTEQPYEVVQVSRNTVRVTPEFYNAALTRSTFKGSLFELEGAYYVVKEKVSTFIYKSIEHKREGLMQVLVKDRVMKDKEGNYLPAKGYETFQLEKMF